MNFPRPFAGVAKPVCWLRATLVGATLLGMLCCLPLWLNTRSYPLSPLLPGLPTLPAPVDKLALGLVLLALVGACRFYRSCICVFLAATLLLYVGDQNRGQPWMYLYWVLLLFSLFPGEPGGAAMRVAISASYLWAGVQKLNPMFFKAIPAWFVQPVHQWGCPNWLVEFLRVAVAAAPFLEIAIGAGVWFAVTRRWALGAVIGLHLVSLVLLGPVGHNVNLVVWPWNLAMIALMVILFSGRATALSLAAAWRALRTARVEMAALALFCLLPLLSYWGWWNSYFSFSLYSGNTARADIYLSENYCARLSPGLQRYVELVKEFDPAFQKPFVFAHLKWAVAELGVPGVPEPAAFAEVFHVVSKAARDEQDCHMVVETRAGRVVLFVPGGGSPKLVEP